MAQLFNFVRQEIGFTFAFYVVHLGEEIGYQFVFLMFALIGGVLAFIPMLFVIFKGEETRKRLGPPKGVNAFDSMLDEEALRERREGRINGGHGGTRMRRSMREQK